MGLVAENLGSTDHRTAMEAGRSVLVLEARGRPGGRALTDTARLGLPYDLGATWLHQAVTNPLVPLAEGLGVTLHDSDALRRELMITDGETQLRLLPRQRQAMRLRIIQYAGTWQPDPDGTWLITGASGGILPLSKAQKARRRLIDHYPLLLLLALVLVVVPLGHDYYWGCGAWGF